MLQISNFILSPASSQIGVFRDKLQTSYNMNVSLFYGGREASLHRKWASARATAQSGNVVHMDQSKSTHGNLIKFFKILWNLHYIQR